MKSFFVLVSILSLCFAANPGNAKIFQRIHRDGTVEYYNLPEEPSLPYAESPDLQSRFNDRIERYAQEQAVDPFLVKCIIKVESDFNPDAVSVAGAMGLMQLMQDTARCYNVKNPFDPDENLRAGIKHFKSLLTYFTGEVPLALAAYHAGLGTVRKRRAIPPIKSTIAYVDRIMYLYTGKKDFGGAVKKLYKRIDEKGDIVIYSK